MILGLPALLLATLAAHAGAARPTAPPPATAAGRPESCIPINQIRRSRVYDDRTIDFFVGSRVYRNVLPQSCPGLGFERAFSYATSLSRLCSLDIITVLRVSPGAVRGPGCGLGPFQPVTGVKP